MYRCFLSWLHDASLLHPDLHLTHELELIEKENLEETKEERSESLYHFGHQFSFGKRQKKHRKEVCGGRHNNKMSEMGPTKKWIFTTIDTVASESGHMWIQTSTSSNSKAIKKKQS